MSLRSGQVVSELGDLSLLGVLQPANTFLQRMTVNE